MNERTCTRDQVFGSLSAPPPNVCSASMPYVPSVVVFARISYPYPASLTYLGAPSPAVIVQAYTKAKEAGKELEVVYVPVADSLEVRTCFPPPPASGFR